MSDARILTSFSFQSTLPARGATSHPVNRRTMLRFQSTLPARGATCRRDPPKYLQDISIHAPRTGSDASATARSTRASPHFNPRSPHGERRNAGEHVRLKTDFNPRSPHGERRAFGIKQSVGVTISIHAPRTGSDAAAQKSSLSGTISIHAPRTGSDGVPAVAAPLAGDFNPRSPHGERRGRRGIPPRPHHFNPRSPHGERPSSRYASAPRASFQSTLPARGATPEVRTKLEEIAFQSTLPARGATSAGRDDGFSRCISIHAPRTGSDIRPDQKNPAASNFNPRSPHGERRGNTPSPTMAFYFNPRSPHGERRTFSVVMFFSS